MNAPTVSSASASGSWSGIQNPVSHWGEFESDEEETSVFDLQEALSKELVADLIDKSCSDDYTKGDPLDGYGDDELDTESYSLDGEVSYSLELRKHIAALKQLILLAQGRVSTSAPQVQQRLPEPPPAPQRPPTHLKHPVVHPLGFLPSRHTPFTLGQGSPPEELCLDSCLYILTKSISALAAHSGWDGAMGETLFVFRDAVDDFLRRLTTMLRVTVDQGASHEGGGEGGFSDPVEQVFHTMGLGSVRDLHSHYQVQILGRIENLENVCSQLTCEYVELANSYNATLPSSSGWDSSIKQEIVSEIEEGEDEDDVPQLHFPSTADGDLALQPSATLQTGFEMLHSLEQQQLLSEEESLRNEEFEEDRKVDLTSVLNISSSQPSKRVRRM
ncbi:STAGA complex 65 subunit gamma-like [Thrips palmi]|uniref:STAGA complex 65 subunit gamma-like n=1 Tax=Thrips palmi TaxID=161013 RepID=A0A6P9A2Q3_THRPL|nr:STAGA complex 65 subunit gamma-like [Thrips palmi]